MEPTIYKPSIYKGAGIYETGAAGGGGTAGNVIQQDFVYKSILGKSYKCVEIDDNIFFPVENLNFYDENIELNGNLSTNYTTTTKCAYYNYTDDGNGLIYNIAAFNYINSIIPANIKKLSNAYFQKILSYLENKIRTWKNDNSLVINDLLDTIFCREFNDGLSLALLDLGIKNFGSYNRLNGFIKYPYGRPQDIYFGVSSGEELVLFENYGKTDTLRIAQISGFNDGFCYYARWIIDEN